MESFTQRSDMTRLTFLKDHSECFVGNAFKLTRVTNEKKIFSDSGKRRWWPKLRWKAGNN